MQNCACGVRFMGRITSASETVAAVLGWIDYSKIRIDRSLFALEAGSGPIYSSQYFGKFLKVASMFKGICPMWLADV